MAAVPLSSQTERVPLTAAEHIITQALRPLRDADQNMFGNTLLLEYMDEALQDVISREGHLHQETTVVAAGSPCGAGSRCAECPG
jgi:hypothetical protein